MLSFLSAFVICLVLTPFLIRFAARKRLFDIPDQRKLHEEEIPRLGGVAIAGAFMISIFLTAPPETLFEYRYFFAGLLILFFVGVWDDLQPVKPWVKLTGELIPVLMLCISAQIDLSALHPALARGMPAAMVLTGLIAFWMVNAFNLIDGINGLAGTIGLISMLAAALLIPASAPLAFAMAGALLAFLFYNIRNPQIFMGDSGSLITGYCAVFFITLEPLPYLKTPAWLLLLPCLSLPLFDMARVFLIRIFHRKNPFMADRNHLHHLLLETGLSHTGATGMLSALTLISALVNYMLINYTTFSNLLVVLSTSLMLLFFTAGLWFKVKKIRQHTPPSPIKSGQLV